MKCIDAKLITETLASVRLNPQVLPFAFSYKPKLEIHKVSQTLHAFEIYFYVLYICCFQGISKRTFVQMDPLNCKEIKCLTKLGSLSGSDAQNFR